MSRRIFNILYLSLVLLLLLMPLFSLDKNEKSVTENRMLAVKPELLSDKALNQDFGRQFDKWLADRFWGRQYLLNLHSRISTFNRYASNKLALVGLNGWQFSLTEINAHHPYSEKQIAIYQDNILYLKRFCDEHAIKCYLEIVPRKEDFAGRQLFKLPYPDKGEKLSRALNKIMPVVYPHAELLAASQESPVYFKSDHHWTEWGAYIAYKALMEEVRKDFPHLKTLTESSYEIFYSPQVRAEIHRKFEYGQTCKKLLHLPDEKCLDGTQYRHYRRLADSRLQVEKYKDNNQLFTRSDAPNKERTLLIGNSFVENFSTFWVNSFAETKKIRTNDPWRDDIALSRWREEILAFHPDIMVILINSYYTYKLDTLSR